MRALCCTRAFRGAFRCVMFVIVTLFVATPGRSETIPVWVYHNFPPFVVNAEAGQGLGAVTVRLPH